MSLQNKDRRCVWSQRFVYDVYEALGFFSKFPIHNQVDEEVADVVDVIEVHHQAMDQTVYDQHQRHKADEIDSQN